jgi:hypothetical protein
MFETKAELIKKEKSGKLQEVAIYNPSAFDAVVLCEYNEDFAFGYYQYMDKEKDYFKVKVNILEEDTSMKIKGRTYRGSNFMRVNF